jgi:hypothetical protein
MANLPSKPSDPVLTRWKAQLDPIIAKPLNSSNFLQNITLNNGTTVINHGLGRIQQGWFLVDSNAAVTPYRSAAFNALTLTLTSGAAATISLIVF